MVAVGSVRCGRLLFSVLVVYANVGVIEQEM